MAAAETSHMSAAESTHVAATKATHVATAAVKATATTVESAAAMPATSVATTMSKSDIADENTQAECHYRECYYREYESFHGNRPLQATNTQAVHAVAITRCRNKVYASINEFYRVGPCGE